MSVEEVSLDELLTARKELIKKLNDMISNEEKEFLISFKEGHPKWSLIGLEGISELPAIKWKLINISKMSSSKHKDAIDKLKRILKY